MHPSGTRGTPMRIVWLIVTVFVSVERAIAHVHDPEWRVFVVVTMCALGFIGGLVVLSDRKQQA